MWKKLAKNTLKLLFLGRVSHRRFTKSPVTPSLLLFSIHLPRYTSKSYIIPEASHLMNTLYPHVCGFFGIYCFTEEWCLLGTICSSIEWNSCSNDLHFEPLDSMTGLILNNISLFKVSLLMSALSLKCKYRFYVSNLFTLLAMGGRTYSCSNTFCIEGEEILPWARVFLNTVQSLLQ